MVAVESGRCRFGVGCEEERIDVVVGERRKLGEKTGLYIFVVGPQLGAVL